MLGAADAVEAVAAGDHVALELVPLAVVRNGSAGSLGVELVDATTSSTSKRSGSSLSIRAAIRSLTTSVWP